MSSLSDKAGFLIVANLIKYAVGFVMPMVMVRMLDRSSYGTYQQLNLISTMAVATLVLGLPNSVYYFYDRKAVARDRVLTLQTSGMLLLSGGITAVLLALGTPMVVAAFKNEAIRPLLGWYGMALGLLIASEHFVQLMIARDRYRVAVLVETAETAIRVAILVLPLLAGYGLMGLILAQLGYAALRFTLRSTWLLLPLGSLRKPEGEPWFAREQLAYSIPLSLMLVVGLLGGFFDRGIVAMRFTASDYAIYSIGALEIPLDAIFQASVATVLRATMPALIREGRHDEVRRLLREGVRKLSLIVLPCFVFLFAYAHDFITVLFTDEYLQSVPVFRIYAFAIPLNMFLLSPVPPAYGRTRLNFHLVVCSTTIHAVLSLTLLHFVGFYGPALSAITTSYLLSLFYFYFACKLTGGTPSSLLPLGTFAKVLAAGTVAIVVCKLALGEHSHSLAGLAGAGVLFAVLFLACCIVARVFTPSDRALARRWMLRVGIGSGTLPG